MLSTKQKEKFWGLTSAEASAHLKKHGKNKLIETKKEHLFIRFIHQLANPMMIVLLVSALLSFLVGKWSHHEGISDTIIIIIVVLMNAILGVVQEAKAEKAIDALKEMTKATCKVYRDQKLTVIPTENVTIGDLIYLEAGDIVPADGEIVESFSLQVDESTLTGESVPIAKNALTHDVYMGSVVTYGRGNFLVTHIGMDTEMGKIAGAINQAKQIETPLQKKLSHLSKVLTILVCLVCVAIFVIHLVAYQDFSIATILNTFMLAISLAVAAIPEGLAAVVTILLSLGVTKMAKRHAIIRKLTAVETLGSTQIICTDKTGTLTENRMKVVDTYAQNKSLLAKAMYFCNDTKWVNQHLEGDPTEVALMEFAPTIVSTLQQDLENEKRVSEIPFDSNRKMMSTFHQTTKGYIQYTKGAIDELLKKCTQYLTADGVRPLTASIKQTILAENHARTQKALRILACAYRHHPTLPQSIQPSVEQNLIFIGFVAMMDPIRPEVGEAIKACRKAHIDVVMITGDHIDTAVSIGQTLGLIQDKSQAMTGEMLNHLSDIELKQNIHQYKVFARVEPLHKARIVEAFQANHYVVAMTGDGVNDAPSIKIADIGIGMGKNGTDVTRNVSDMVLADDNFATIVDAIEEGRRIYANIQKAILFLLSSNLSEVLSILIASILGFTLLDPTHILWINLITDSFPAIALGMDPLDESIMNEPPRSSKENIFSRGGWFDIIYQGVFVTLLTLFAYAIGNYLAFEQWGFQDHTLSKAMAFLTMSMAETFHAFNMRSRTDSIFKIIKNNKYLWLSCLASVLLTTMVIYIPQLAKLFHFEAIPYYAYSISIGLGLMIIPLVELVKKIRRKHHS